MDMPNLSSLNNSYKEFSIGAPGAGAAAQSSSKRGRSNTSVFGKWYPIYTENVINTLFKKGPNVGPRIIFKNEAIEAPNHRFIDETYILHEFVSADGHYKMICVDITCQTLLEEVPFEMKCQENFLNYKALHDVLKELNELRNHAPNMETGVTTNKHAIIYVFKNYEGYFMEPLLMIGYCLYAINVSNDDESLETLKYFCMKTCPIQPGNKFDSLISYWRDCAPVAL